MLGIREFNNKISNLKNTLKITSSMKMMSTIKLQKYSRIKQSTISYAQSVDQTAAIFNCALTPLENSIPNVKPGPSKVIILFFTGDRGLCGRYNSNVFREALKLSEKLKKEKYSCSFSCSGLKGRAFLLRYKLPIESFYLEASAHPDLGNAIKIADDCITKFYSGVVQEIHLVYTKRKSLLFEEPVVEKLLPLEFDTSDSITNKNEVNSKIVEATTEMCMKQVLELKTLSKIYSVLLESAVSEHSARMSTMETATANCERMIEHYLQLRNRARQTAITTELSEIVTGKEALEH